MRCENTFSGRAPTCAQYELAVSTEFAVRKFFDFIFIARKLAGIYYQNSDFHFFHNFDPSIAGKMSSRCRAPASIEYELSEHHENAKDSSKNPPHSQRKLKESYYNQNNFPTWKIENRAVVKVHLRCENTRWAQVLSQNGRKQSG